MYYSHIDIDEVSTVNAQHLYSEIFEGKPDTMMIETAVSVSISPKMRSLSFKCIDLSDSPLFADSGDCDQKSSDKFSINNICERKREDRLSIWSKMRTLFRGRVSSDNFRKERSVTLERLYLESRLPSRCEEKVDNLHSVSSDSESFQCRKRRTKLLHKKQKSNSNDNLSYFAAFDFLVGIIAKKTSEDRSMGIELSNLNEPLLDCMAQVNLKYSMNEILISPLLTRISDGNHTNFQSSSYERDSTALRSSINDSEKMESRSETEPFEAILSSQTLFDRSPEDSSQVQSLWRIIGSERSWHPLLSAIFKRFIRYIRPYFPQTRSDDQFYESIRLQPISSGYYIRTMLVSGFCNTCFYLYHCLAWSFLTYSIESTTTLQQIYLSWLYVTTIAQFVLHIFQLPSRVQLHFRCWESSSAADTDGSLLILRTMVQGDNWLYNRALNYAIYSIAVFNLVLSELYLWSSMSSDGDPIRDLVVSLAATDMLSFWVKAFVAVIFSISMSSAYVLRDAKRRGLSKWDLDELPTCVFTSASEVKNCDCSICLSSFTCGEELISLPCDQKHSFHAGCIRQWLQRQNSCPLCQKIV